MQIVPFINGDKRIYRAKTNLLMTSWLHVARGASPPRLRADGRSQGNFQTMTAPSINTQLKYKSPVELFTAKTQTV